MIFRGATSSPRSDPGGTDARSGHQECHHRRRLSDGGAHYAHICDASASTFLLTHWARDRRRGERLPLELVVQKQTSATADLFGLHDRGRLAVGSKADLDLIDFERLSLRLPEMVHDLPTGAGRLMQEADGYLATVLSGQVIREGGADTGARPGRVLRGPQPAVTMP